VGLFDHRTGWTGEPDATECKQRISLLVEPLPPIESWTDRVETVFADSAYQGLENDIESELGWSLNVVEPEGEKAGFSVDPKRSGPKSGPSVGSAAGAG
jgi:hypothetical protein